MAAPAEPGGNGHRVRFRGRDDDQFLGGVAVAQTAHHSVDPAAAPLQLDQPVTADGEHGSRGGPDPHWDRIVE